MKAEMELIKQIKTLGAEQMALQSEHEIIFLNNLKHKLEVYMYQNPVRMGKFENFYYNIKGLDPFVNFKNISLLNNTYANSAALALIVLMIGIGGIASASQASLPGDNLYPVKIFSEELRSALTVSPSAKALLEVEFSAKRIEEIKKVVQKSGIESKNIDVALDRLQKNTAKAADIINKEKQNGNDVSALARDIEEKNNANQNTLKQVLKKTEKEINELSDENKNNESENNAERSAKEKEHNERKNNEKDEEIKPDSSLRKKKSETKKDENRNINNSEIKIKNNAEKIDDGSDNKNDENND